MYPTKGNTEKKPLLTDLRASKFNKELQQKLPSVYPFLTYNNFDYKVSFTLQKLKRKWQLGIVWQKTNVPSSLFFLHDSGFSSCFFKKGWKHILLSLRHWRPTKTPMHNDAIELETSGKASETFFSFPPCFAFSALCSLCFTFWSSSFFCRWCSLISADTVTTN